MTEQGVVEPAEKVIAEELPSFDAETLLRRWRRRGGPTVYKLGKGLYGLVREEVRQHIRDSAQPTESDRAARGRAIRRAVRQPREVRETARTGARRRP